MNKTFRFEGPLLILLNIFLDIFLFKYLFKTLAKQTRNLPYSKPLRSSTFEVQIWNFQVHLFGSFCLEAYALYTLKMFKTTNLRIVNKAQQFSIVRLLHVRQYCPVSESGSLCKPGSFQESDSLFPSWPFRTLNQMSQPLVCPFVWLPYDTESVLQTI